MPPSIPASTSGSGRTKRAGIAAVVTVGVLALALTGYAWNRYPLNRPVTYADPAEHFKYGSIGADVENGLPLEILKILPQAFPEYLPKGSPHDLTAFGFIQEAGHDLPIGFSTRRHLIPLAGLNCAACHVGSWRASATETAITRLGMPAENVNLGAYFEFLFNCAADSRFSAAYLMPFMKLGFVDRALYGRVVIPKMREGLLERRTAFASFFTPARAPFGYGRVDTFDPYKLNQLVSNYPNGIPEAEAIGTADFPSIWGRKMRQGLALNWDGNSPGGAHDRDVGAAFGAGATRESIDTHAIDRVNDFLLTLTAPAYPYGITRDTAQLARGEHTFRQYCAACHAFGGANVGKVEPWEAIKTDRHRLDSYTAKLNKLLIDYGAGYPWQLTDMVKTNGYVNAPLDGVWARAPYLHNGSVPTLWDLLTPEDKRNGGKPTFWTGHGMYDTVNVGIRTDVADMNGRPSTPFDITRAGNSNRGHSGAYYGTELSVADKRALIEYLKTLH